MISYIEALEKERQEAYKKHVAMWTAMKEELGDTPLMTDRIDFKRDYTLYHDGGYHIISDCYLCDFVKRCGLTCNECPVDWKAGSYMLSREPQCQGETDWRTAPISKILALPEMEYDV